MKGLDQIHHTRLLMITAALSAVPFLLVELFKSSFYIVMGVPHYLIFHNVAEFFSIVVSFSIFGLGWYAYDQNNNQHSLFLSAAFLVTGLIDFMHTLGFTGMPALITPNQPNKASQFWVIVRFFDASAYLASAFILSSGTKRWLSKRFLMPFALAIPSAVFITVIFFPDYIPATFIPGVGLTQFKKYSEYVIISILVLAIFAYIKRLSKSGERAINYYLIAFTICIFSELSFTLYSSFYDTFNMIGHIYKIAAFMFIYKGIFVVSISKPYEDLHQNNKLLSCIINTIPLALFWKDKESVFLGCNQVFAQLAYIDNPDNIIGLSDYDLPWSREESDRYRADDRFVMERAEAKYHIIETLHQADGTDLWIDATKIPLTDLSGSVSGILGVLEDITWRRRAERELKDTSDKLKLLLDSAGEAIYGIDLEGKCTFCNASCLRMTGFERQEQLIGFNMHSLIHHSHADGSPYDEKDCRIFHAFQKEIGTHVDDEVLWRADGTSFPVEYWSYPLLENGSSIGAVVAFVEITERKRAEETLRRLNRELRAISICNQAMMKATDEQTLLADICRIVCDEACYRMAWVGYAENDDEKSVRVAAWAGTEDGYLAEAHFTWADTERGRGPAGVAIRSGRTDCSQDFATDPRMVPWRENALYRSYRSSIALPLKDENSNVFGVTSIYSEQPNAFTPEEIRLMEELAGNLAFGITALRTRNARKEAEQLLKNAAMSLNEAQRLAHIGNWELNLTTNTLAWSDEIYRIFEIDREKFGATYDAFLDLIHPDDRETVNYAYSSSLKTRTPYTIDHRLRFPDRRIKYVHEQCETYFENDIPIRSIGTVQDITARKQAEETVMKLNAELEERVQARTAELAAKNAELERLNRLFVGRELRMVELKKRIAELEGKRE